MGETIEIDPKLYTILKEIADVTKTDPSHVAEILIRDMLRPSAVESELNRWKIYCVACGKRFEYAWVNIIDPIDPISVGPFCNKCARKVLDIYDARKDRSR